MSCALILTSALLGYVIGTVMPALGRGLPLTLTVAGIAGGLLGFAWPA